MKIVSGAQIKKIDEYTIQHEPIASIDLMERASQHFVQQLLSDFEKTLKDHPIIVFAGSGNNGGDGLAIARILDEKGYDVSVFSLLLGNQKSKDFSINEEHLLKTGVDYSILASNTDFPKIPSHSVIIDAIFGTGLNRATEGLALQLITHINQSQKQLLVSVDIPSGLFSEGNAEQVKDSIIQADATFTFELPKLCFLFPENEQYVGNWKIVPIGLHREAIAKQKSPYQLLEKEKIRSIHKKRSKFGHKGTYGHSLIIAGSKNMIGAALLSTKACLKSGSGLTTVHAPACAEMILQSQVSEVLFSPDKHDLFISSLPQIGQYTAIAIGPGIGKQHETKSVVQELLNSATAPLVLDADALNIIAENPSLLSLLPIETVLTPHPKEFERLIQCKTKNSFEQLRMQRDFSKKHHVITIVKGAYTAIATPSGEVYFNTTGNPGMATGGTGDVLTGIITGLISSGYSPLEAALLGVYIHGKAGDIGLKKESHESLTASDIIQHLGKAFRCVS